VIDSLGVGHCYDLTIILLNDECKLELLQEAGSRTRQEIPQTACCKARACNCCFKIFVIEMPALWSLTVPQRRCSLLKNSGLSTVVNDLSLWQSNTSLVLFERVTPWSVATGDIRGKRLPNFIMPRKFCYKDIIKQTSFPLNVYFPLNPWNLATGL